MLEQYYILVLIIRFDPVYFRQGLGDEEELLHNEYTKLNGLYAQEILKAPTKQFLASTENIGTVQIEKELLDAVNEDPKDSSKILGFDSEFNFEHGSTNNPCSVHKYDQERVGQIFEVQHVQLKYDWPY